jgi:hypothetical protein
MAGLDLAIHDFTCSNIVKTWMPGSSPGMTTIYAWLSSEVIAHAKAGPIARPLPPRRAYQPFLKQRRPNGPECQPGGQLYIGRHPP